MFTKEKVKEFFDFFTFTLKIVIVGFAVYGIMAISYQFGVPKPTEEVKVSEAKPNGIIESISNKYNDIIGNPPDKIIYNYDNNQYVYKLEEEKEDFFKENTREKEGIINRIVSYPKKIKNRISSWF